MTKSREQKLRVFSIVLLVSSMFFILEGGGQIGWQNGVALLIWSGVCLIDTILTSRKPFQFVYAVLGLTFFALATKNFLAH